MVLYVACCDASVCAVLPTMCLNEPRSAKTGLRGFRPGPTQTGLYSHRRWLETRNFVFRK